MKEEEEVRVLDIGVKSVEDVEPKVSALVKVEALRSRYV